MSEAEEPLGPAGVPSLAVGAYSETLVRNRRVVILGDATLPLAEDLMGRGARLVHVYDSHAGRVSVGMAQRAGSRTTPPVVVALLGDDLGVRDGAFDVVLIPNLPLLGVDANEVLRRARRLVSPTGAVIIASPNPGAQRFLALQPAQREVAPSYYDLFDAASLQFPEVKMLGQAPFVGYAIVDFSESDPGISVDTSLLAEPETPEWFLVVASDRPQDLDPYSLVAVPLETIAQAMPDEHLTIQPPPMPVAAMPSEEEIQLAEARARISVLITENEKLRESQAALARAERLASDAVARASSLDLRVGEVEAEKATATLKNHALERRLDDLERALGEASHARDVAVNELGDREHQLSELSAEVEHLRAELESKVDALTRHELESVATRERRIAELEAQIAALDPPTLRSKEMHEKRILALEAQRADLTTQLATQRADFVAQLQAQRAELTTLRNEQSGKERELTAKIAELTAKLAERDRALSDKDRALGDVGRALAERERALADASKGVAAAERERDLARAELAKTPSTESLQRLEALVEEERSKSKLLEEEIGKAEAMLRRRGKDVVALQRDAAELTRVGKELLRDLLSLRAANDGGNVGGGNGGGGNGGSLVVDVSRFEAEIAELRGRLEAATAEAARKEADRVAMQWRVDQLARELRDRGATGSERHAALERALFQSQQELARAKGATAAPRESSEDAVLLEQVAHR